MNKETIKVIEALRYEISNQNAAIRTLNSVLRQLHFCSARVRKATFRAIDRRQFDQAIESAEKTLAKNKTVSKVAGLPENDYWKRPRKDKQVQQFCTCYKVDDPYRSDNDKRGFVVILKGKICCELCKYPLDQVKWNNNEL